MSLDVAAVDVLVEEHDGRLGAAVKKLDVVNLKLFHSGILAREDVALKVVGRIPA